MSFYSDPKGIHPGPVRGNAAEGLGQRVAISVRRVLDSCMKKMTENAVLLIGEPKNLSNEVIAVDKKLVSPPLRFITAQSSGPAAEVRDLVITRLPERPVFARVCCNIVIPMRVAFEDASGKRHTAKSFITIPQDVIMYVPEASVFPYEVAASASCTTASGRFVSPNEFHVTARMTVITKVVADTDLLVPAYGICPAPKAVDFEQEASKEFFDLPLYPQGRAYKERNEQSERGEHRQYQ